MMTRAGAATSAVGIACARTGSMRSCSVCGESGGTITSGAAVPGGQDDAAASRISCAAGCPPDTLPQLFSTVIPQTSTNATPRVDNVMSAHYANASNLNAAPIAVFACQSAVGLGPATAM